MDNNELNNQSSEQKSTYRATSNLNIDMENPQINVNSVVGVNIKDVPDSTFSNDRFSNVDMNTDDYTSFDMSTNYQEYSNSNHYVDDINKYGSNSFENSVSQSFEPNTTSINLNENSNSSGSSHQFIPNISDSEKVLNKEEIRRNVPVYEPTLEEKKQKKVNFSVSIELKVTIFIVFILFVFIMIMPYLYDFLKNLQLALTR